MENFNLDDFDRMLFGQNTRANAGDLKCPICNQSQRTKGWLNWHIKNKKCLKSPAHTREPNDPEQTVRMDYMVKKYFTDFFTWRLGMQRIGAMGRITLYELHHLRSSNHLREEIEMSSLWISMV